MDGAASVLVVLFELPALFAVAVLDLLPVEVPVDAEEVVAVDAVVAIPLEVDKVVELTGVSHKIGLAAGSENWPF
jgi:hypothetical protein